jgi:tetratricopeptide (TPR) repeat protein
MDLVKGVPITTYCDEHHLTPRQRLELFLPVCQAVQHAHQKGIIHRDLKPSNVLVALYDGQPVPKVIDFGVAKAAGQPLTDKTLLTGFGSIVGTLEYMSPEQAEINQMDVDTRSDVYSLGVLLYELLAGSPPFTRKELEKGGMLEMLRVIREQEPSKPSTKLSTAEGLPTLAANRGTEPAKLTKLVRGELDWIVLKALEKDRSRRYETASAFAADVQCYLNDEPVQACPPSALYRFRKFARRNKVAFAMASVVVMALTAVGVAAVFAYRHQAAEQQRLADQQAHAQRLLAEQRQHALERAFVAALSGDFDGVEKAISEAESLGALPGRIHWLRGQVAFHQGDVEAARQHLEQAVRLMPQSVAARAMLAVAYYHSGQNVRYNQLARELDTMTPRCPEDFLFKGQVESFRRPEQALQTLDKAGTLRNSVIGWSARLEARYMHALFTDDVRVAQQALDGARAAKEMLPDNPVVLARSVHAHLVASGVFAARGQPERSQEAREQAGHDAGALEPFSSVPMAQVACFHYFEYVDDTENALAVSALGAEFRLATILYRRGAYDQALDAADRAAARGSALARVERGFILAELPDGRRRAWAAFEAIAAADELGDLRLYAPMIPQLLGRKADAEQASRKIRDGPADLMPRWYRGWYDHYLKYQCGLSPEGELLRAAGSCRPKLCEAHFLIGLRHLSEGDRDGAGEHFQKCADTRVFIYWDYMWARAYLARMEKEPRWPSWLPLKK